MQLKARAFKQFVPAPMPGAVHYCSLRAAVQGLYNPPTPAPLNTHTRTHHTKRNEHALRGGRGWVPPPRVTAAPPCASAHRSAQATAAAVRLVGAAGAAAVGGSRERRDAITRAGVPPLHRALLAGGGAGARSHHACADALVCRIADGACGVPRRTSGAGCGWVKCVSVQSKRGRAHPRRHTTQGCNPRGTPVAAVRTTQREHQPH